MRTTTTTTTAFNLLNCIKYISIYSQVSVRLKSSSWNVQCTLSAICISCWKHRAQWATLWCLNLLKKLLITYLLQQIDTQQNIAGSIKKIFKKLFTYNKEKKTPHLCLNSTSLLLCTSAFLSVVCLKMLLWKWKGRADCSFLQHA